MAVSQQPRPCFYTHTHTGGETPQDACAICPRGTYSANRGTDRCIPCPSGFTSEEGATEIEQCYSENACPAGQGVFVLL